MINYNEFIINKLKEFVERDEDLSQIIPKNFNYETNEEEFNIIEEYENTNQDDELFPCITVATIQNSAREFNINNIEIETSVGWQITIYSMAVDYNGLKKPSTMCNFIAQKISNFIEKELRFNRVGVSPLMPLSDDNTNQLYSISLRYNAKHNLLLNFITRR